jgi:hypothetical protein
MAHRCAVVMILNINGRSHEVDADADMPLLWILRDRLNLSARNTDAASGSAARVRCSRTAPPFDRAWSPPGARAASAT